MNSCTQMKCRDIVAVDAHDYTVLYRMTVVTMTSLLVTDVDCRAFYSVFYSVLFVETRKQHKQTTNTQHTMAITTN